MKKKMMTAVLAMTMVAAAVAGCGSSSGSGTTVELTNEAGGDAQAETQKAEADQTAAEGTVYKVGIVQYVDDASLNQIEKAIEAELTAKGAELGVTFDYADYTFNGQADQSILTQIAADLVADDVDLIIPIATPTAVVMQIPVVFSAVSDPVGAGLAADVNAPGSNITGTSDAIDTAAIFDLMLAANPDTAKVGLLYDKSQASSLGAIEDAKAYCDEKGIAYVEKTGTTSAEVQAAADALVAEGVDAVFTPQDNTVMTAELSIFEKFIDAGIPHYTGADSFALNGAFCGYGVNYEELGTKTADMAVDILVNGADPAATPIENLERGIVTVNTETAEALGLDYSMFKDMCSEVVETVTAEEFE